MSILMCAGASRRNIIKNGSFKRHAQGWTPNMGDVLAEWSGDESHMGANGSLALSSQIGEAQGVYLPDYRGALLPTSLTTIDAALWAKTDADDVTIDWTLTFYNSSGSVTDLVDTSGTPTTLTNGTWTECTAPGISVPANSVRVAVSVNARLMAVDGPPVYIDDIFVGPVGGAHPPYQGSSLPALPIERLSNGTFETNTTGWDGWWGDETISRETAAPITGTGSLKCIASGAGHGAFTPTSGKLFVRVGEELTVSFRAKGTGSIDAFLDWSGYTAEDGATVGTAALSGTAQLFSYTVTVPYGATAATLAILASGGASTFTIDDVAVTKTADPA